mgnify:CR=1 FL=1
MIRYELSGNFDESVGMMCLIAKSSCLVSGINGLRWGVVIWEVYSWAVLRSTRPLVGL